MKVIFIDTDVFVRDLRYPNDALSEPNRLFLRKIKRGKQRGVTSIFNLLEVCGILSYNLNHEQLFSLYAGFMDRYRVKILFPSDSEGGLLYPLDEIFGQIQKRQNLGDAQVAMVVNRFASKIDKFVSWNSSDFEGRVDIPVCKPSEY